MKLRPELQFPKLDESKVERLSELAATIDGARPGEWEDELAEFNHLADTSLEFAEFQGIYGGMEHESWVRNVLCMPLAEKRLTLTNDEMLEIISRLCQAAGEEHEQFFWIKLLETNLDPRISDLIYWPGEYFGDGDNSREMSPRDILDTALKSKAQRRTTRNRTATSMPNRHRHPASAKMTGRYGCRLSQGAAGETLPVERETMAIDLESATTALQEDLPIRARWMLNDVPLAFDFSRAQLPLRAVDAEELGGEPDAEWFDLLVFGERDYADGGGACPWLTVHRKDGSVYGLDPEREQSIFLLNSSVRAFIQTFTLFDKYFSNDAAFTPDIAARVEKLDPTVYADSEWRLFVEHLVTA